MTSQLGLFAFDAPQVAPVAAVRPAPVVPVADQVPVLLAVDGNSLVHRAFHAYAKAGLTDSAGRPRGAVHGFVSLLASVAEQVKDRFGVVPRVVVGFDSRTNARKAQWPHYKATRSKADPSLYDQMDQVQVLLGRLGVSVVVVDGWEADDVIGSAATAAVAVGWHAVVATSDRDAFSLIDESTTVLRVGAGPDRASWLTPQSLEAAYNIAPSAYPLYAAIRGDNSDNLPGVPGVGEKRAAALLDGVDCTDPHAALELLAADPERLRAALGPKGAGNFVDAADKVRDNLAVMKIRRDLDVDVTVVAVAVDADVAATVLRSEELPSMVRRVQESMSAGAPIVVRDPALRGPDGDPGPSEPPADDWF